MAGINIWGVLGAAAILLAGGGYIAYQSTQIDGLRNEKVLLVEKVQKLEATIDLSIRERVRLASELKDYQNRKAEIEVKYINKPVTVFKEIIKTVPPEKVSTEANKELNALFDDINSSAVDFSLRNSPN
jgi:hypothetical protein